MASEISGTLEIMSGAGLVLEGLCNQTFSSLYEISDSSRHFTPGIVISFTEMSILALDFSETSTKKV
jgi:hypothetical protein